MDDRHDEYPRLKGEVGLDEGHLGGAPKSLAGAAAPRGRRTTRPMVLVAADRDGQTRAAVVPDGTGAKIAEWVDPDAAWPMTDGNQPCNATGRRMAGHGKVMHSQGQ